MVICSHTKECPYYQEYLNHVKDIAADSAWHPDDSLPIDVLAHFDDRKSGYYCKAWVYYDKLTKMDDFKRGPSECEPLKILNLLVEINDKLGERR